MQKELLLVEKNHLKEILKEQENDRYILIDNDFKIRLAYDAVHIEGTNSVTLEEAYTLKKVIKEHTLSELEQKELLNHVRAYEFINEHAKKQTPISEEFIKDIHQIILDEIMPGGLYRQVNVGLKGSIHQPPDYVKVYDRMKRLINHLDFEFVGDAIEKAAYVHLSIAKIHPFLDGNGRLGRLLMNYCLIRDGYLPISIDEKVKIEYFESLDSFKLEKTTKKLEDIIVKLLLVRYNEVILKLTE